MRALVRRPLNAAATCTLALAVAGAAGCAKGAISAEPAALPRHDDMEQPTLVIRRFTAGLSGTHAKNPDVKLAIGHDAEQVDEPVLVVDYPPPTGDEAGRDVWCDAEHDDWSGGQVVSFRAKPDHDVRLSVSFFARNRVVYTTWIDLRGGVWQPVRVRLDLIRPNPYFQRPDANLTAPIDVTEVKGIAFAPHDDVSGRLVITSILLF